MHSVYISLLVKLLLMVIGMTALAIAFEAVFSHARSTAWIWSLSIAGSFFLAAIISGRVAQKRLRSVDSTVFPLTVQTVQDIVLRLDATVFQPDVYVQSCAWKQFRLRTLILYSAVFDPQLDKARRKRVHHAINKSMHSAQRESFFDAVNSCRVEIQVCNTMSPELKTWVCANTPMLLSRTESIVRAAISLEPPEIQLPKVINATTPVEIRKYMNAIILLSALVD